MVPFIPILHFCSSLSLCYCYFILYISILHLYSSPHPPPLASAFYRQPGFSTMPFGCSVLHFPYITLWQVTVQWLQDLLSSNYMLMIILLFKVRGENLVRLEGLVMGWQVCACGTLVGDSAVNHSVAWRNGFCFHCCLNHFEFQWFISGSEKGSIFLQDAGIYLLSLTVLLHYTDRCGWSR